MRNISSVSEGKWTKSEDKSRRKQELLERESKKKNGSQQDFVKKVMIAWNIAEITRDFASFIARPLQLNQRETTGSESLQVTPSHVITGTPPWGNGSSWFPLPVALKLTMEQIFRRTRKDTIVDNHLEQTSSPPVNVVAITRTSVSGNYSHKYRLEQQL